ncbi:MAG: hypothetical protein FJ354_06520 [Thaumarchaeota archaeon]|nr:hypothetical protein [Nitrososphaerota archaeon]
MSVKAAMIMTAISIGLLVIYAADVAYMYGTGSENGFLPLDTAQRGMGLGGPALILPIIAFAITIKKPSKPLGILIIVVGILIIVGGLAAIFNSSPSTSSEKNPIASALMLFAPGAIQLILGGIKLKKSARS